MTISSVQHAEKMILRKVAKGPVGTEDKPFINCMFQGRRPSLKEVDYMLSAVDNLEDSHAVQVHRTDGAATPVRAEKYVKAQAAVPKKEVLAPKGKPIPHRAELVAMLHRLLQRDAGEEGKILNGRTADKYIKILYDELAFSYDVTLEQVTEAFNVLSALGLRGHAKSLHGIGMEVSSLKLFTDDAEDYMGAPVANISSADDQLRSENARLSEEVRRLQQQFDGLRGRIEAAVKDSYKD